MEDIETINCKPMDKVYLFEKRPFTAKKEADALLEEFDDLATEMGIVHFLVHGTCIGLYLEGHYCVTDPDIDVGILCTKEKREELFERMIKQGFIRNQTDQDIKWNCTFLKEGIMFDVYYAGHHIPTKYLNSFDTLKYNGRTYNIPHPIEKYLEASYGKGWQTPKFPGLLIPDEILDGDDAYQVGEGWFFMEERTDDGKQIFRKIPPLFLLIINRQKLIRLVPFGPEEIRKIYSPEEIKKMSEFKKKYG